MNLLGFMRLAKQVQALRDAEGDWKDKFDVLFDELAPQIMETGVVLDNWYDPDTSYQEDALAFAQAVIDKANALRPIVESIYGKE